jgi:hypothetical protein
MSPSRSPWSLTNGRRPSPTRLPKSTAIRFPQPLSVPPAYKAKEDRDLSKRRRSNRSKAFVSYGGEPGIAPRAWRPLVAGRHDENVPKWGAIGTSPAFNLRGAMLHGRRGGLGDPELVIADSGRGGRERKVCSCIRKTRAVILKAALST